MTRLEFLGWLRQRPHGDTWEWFETLDNDGSRCFTVQDPTGILIQGRSWDEVAVQMQELGFL